MSSSANASYTDTVTIRKQELAIKGLNNLQKQFTTSYFNTIKQMKKHFREQDTRNSDADKAYNAAIDQIMKKLQNDVNESIGISMGEVYSLIFGKSESQSDQQVKQQTGEGEQSMFTD